MEGSECELVETAFSDNSALGKESIAELSNNLESLNTVYGNMLSAMNVSRS